MTVLIKGMKMPKSCAECRFDSGCDGCQGYENHCVATEDCKDIGYDRDGYGKTVPAGVEITPTERRMEWCPLVEVPVPHGRLIDGDAMMKRLKAWDTNDAMDKALYNFALNRVLEAPTVEPEKEKPRWIPVTERLPEDDVDVLISYRYREGEGDTKHTKIDITSFGPVYFGGHKVGNHTHWRPPFEYFESNYEVIAWMPLPKPYQEPVTHLESMHLYPKEKERLEALQSQGFEVVTCNNWLCPFNNDGYCVSPGHGDECTIYGDEDFKKYLDDVYNESFSLDLRELTRQLMIMKWGRENDDTKRD